MDVTLGIAGLLCLLLGVGHASTGLLWVLPRLSVERLPTTPFGPPQTTLGVLRVTWHIVTVFVLALGAVLLALAWDVSDARTIVLRGFAGMWLVAFLMALWVARRSPRQFLRRPIPLLWLLLAVLLWDASA